MLANLEQIMSWQEAARHQIAHFRAQRDIIEWELARLMEDINHLKRHQYALEMDEKQNAEPLA